LQLLPCRLEPCKVIAGMMRRAGQRA
jgi:hypothetical protein